MKTYKKLIKSREQYECAISSLEQELESKIDFDFFIVYQQSDLESWLASSLDL